MERRSATGRTPRKRYSNDPFEGIEGLLDTESNHETSLPQVMDDDGELDEFEADGEEPSDEDEFSEGQGEIEENGPEETSNAGELLLHQTKSGVADSDEMEDGFPKMRRRPTQKADSKGVETFTRGVAEAMSKNYGKEARRQLYFGPSADDYQPVHAAKVKWAYEPTLPTRTTAEDGFGGMHRSFFMNDESWANDVKHGEEWWVEKGGKDIFMEKQVLQDLDRDRAVEYMPRRANGVHQFLMGPYKNQQLFKLAVGESLALQDAWHPSAQSDQAPPSCAKDYKCGFMLNLGATIQCLDWAPNQDGRDQYLVVSSLPQRETDHPPYEAPDAPAFTPQPRHKSNVQIWRFRSTGEHFIDTETAPHLQLMLCGDWGDAKALKWCPVPCEALSKADERDLGLLAGIWSDGAIRVLHVVVPRESSEASPVYVNETAFELRAPGSVFTCLTWIGGNRIAAGCANGCIAVWDLHSSMKPSLKNPRPMIYSSICTSYILSISSCYPSRPNMLFTSSMNGDVRMTDLSRSRQSLCSQASSVCSQRNRIGHPLLAWHDFAQVVLHVDETFTLRGSAIRRIFQTVSLGRYKSNATALASSPCHPFVLIGTASGEVISQNVIRRVITGKGAVFQQTWFAHEWRRPRDASTAAAALTNGHAQGANKDDGENPSVVRETDLSRISEGFKVARVSLMNQEGGLHMATEGTQYATIYEEKSAITALAWNPNLHVGGWAAAGMGDGLLRIEDIATPNID